MAASKVKPEFISTILESDSFCYYISIYNPKTQIFPASTSSIRDIYFLFLYRT